MSESRSLTNFIGNGVAAIVIAKSERELDTEAPSRELSGRRRAEAAVAVER
jgi:aerobic C4-dicarboxylate transport protein